MFQDYGALTDAEYGQMIGSLPGELKKKGVQDIVDLSEIPPELANPMRKVRLFFKSEAGHQKCYLSGQNQLVENQNDTVFNYLAAASINARPTELRPSSKRPKTVPKLVEEHAEVEGKVTAELPQQPADADDDGLDEADFKPKRQAGIANIPTTGKAVAKRRGKKTPPSPTREIETQTHR